MTDLSSAIVPKSDQLNADDLLTGPRTIVVTRVTKSSGEQPVSIYFEGDDGKPYKPCKSMIRVLVAFWGKNGNAYAGRAMTLFREPGVMYGGAKVGGIRISHLSNIEREQSLALTVTNKKRAPYVVQPLTEKPATRPQSPPAGGASSSLDASPQGDEAASLAAENSPPSLDTFTFALTDPKTKAERTTTDGKAWADHLVKQIGKLPFDAAKALYDENKPNIALASEGGEAAAKFAALVRDAWSARQKAAAE